MLLDGKRPRPTAVHSRDVGPCPKKLKYQECGQEMPRGAAPSASTAMILRQTQQAECLAIFQEVAPLQEQSLLRKSPKGSRATYGAVPGNRVSRTPRSGRRRPALPLGDFPTDRSERADIDRAQLRQTQAPTVCALRPYHSLRTARVRQQQDNRVPSPSLNLPLRCPAALAWGREHIRVYRQRCGRRIRLRCRQAADNQRPAELFPQHRAA